MNPIQDRVKRYLAKSGLKGPWKLKCHHQPGFQGAVIIPSLAEGDSLFETLSSLSRNGQEWINRFLVVIVFNHAEKSDRESKQQNQKDLSKLLKVAGHINLALGWVDAISPGLELSNRYAGVGFARKLGMDFALELLDWSTDPFLACLDADTLVEKNYLKAMVEHFDKLGPGAAVLPFCHQSAAEGQQHAIDRYELFLRSYIYGLRLAGSRYAFHTVGSAMACRARSYIRAGGMNVRKAGEDFYFLQQLSKTDGVAALTGTMVYPSARISKRVPFGTGRSMERLLNGDDDAVLFYPVAPFRILAEWLQVVELNLVKEAQILLANAAEISPVLSRYLLDCRWLSVWPALQKTHQSKTQLQNAFHAWFDGFKTLRLIHQLCESGHRRGEPEELLPDYFAWDGQTVSGNVREMLEWMRANDLGGTATNTRKFNKAVLE